MSEDLSRRFEIDALRAELARAKVRGSVGVALGISAMLISLCALDHGGGAPGTVMPNTPPPAAPTASNQPSNASDQPSNATFQTITAKSIQITDDNGSVVATLDSGGLSVSGPFGGLKIINPGQTVFQIDDNGLYFYGNGGTLVLTPYELLLSSSNSGKSSTSIYSGNIQVDTQQDYIVSLGAIYGEGPPTAGVYVYNQRFDKDHADGASINASSASFSPNNISLADTNGIIRVSIGQTPLTTPATGENETTGLSSVVLFDTSGHVSWETP